MGHTRVTRAWLAALLALALAAASGCASGARPPGSDGAIEVVAAENTWGSLVSQLGGPYVRVTNIISNPDADPHDYEPKPADGRAIARARYVVMNGLGYDSWADRLVAANPSSSRRVLRVGDVVGLREGANPHRWYSPPDVTKVLDQMTADLKALAPEHAAAFDARRSEFEEQGLRDYRATIADIKARYGGTSVGATENIVTPLAEALGLRVLSPEAFLNAISEGADPTPQDKATMDEQIRQGQIAVLIVNTQNETPDVKRLVEAAKARRIPVVGVTETPSPVKATFQDWQTKQLRSLADALREATGK